MFQTDFQEDATEDADHQDDMLPTVDEEDEFHDPEADENEEQLDECDDGQPSNLEGAIAEIAEVLTVTSKKLQASVLGRKFTNRRSIEERKKTSSCSAGHWAGDSACSMSGQKGKRCWKRIW